MTSNIVLIPMYNFGGTQISIVANNDYSSACEGNIRNFIPGTFLDHALSSAIKACIQLVVNIINPIQTKFRNMTLTNVKIIRLGKLKYLIVKHYPRGKKNISKNSFIMLNANYFHEWEIDGITIENEPYNHHLYFMNSLSDKNNPSNITILLASQKNYNNFLLLRRCVWIVMFLTESAIYVILRGLTHE